MEQTPTAEEYIKQHPYIDSFLSSAQGYDVLTRFMKEFAKIHVEAALKEASEKAEVYADEGGYSEFVDEQSILNSYSLDNIK